MTEGAPKVRMLVNNDIKRFESFMMDLSGMIEIRNLDGANNLNEITPNEISDIDVVVFDLYDDFTFNWQTIKELKKLKPDIKTILFTSMRNRRYRRHFLSRGVDFFIFKENEGDLLKSVLKQFHIRKSRYGA